MSKAIEFSAHQLGDGTIWIGPRAWKKLVDWLEKNEVRLVILDPKKKPAKKRKAKK